ncbi:hypothetical protein M5K25_007401 [Dendrobium thyrsiflorum]|uniref:Uncharacterized protein n=1 Tax=Dendrobium thyrsiflorum TaxID=117978 RepID=A0ABD0VLF9_DENTH
MMGHDLFGHGGSIFGATSNATHRGFLQHGNLPPNRSEGPIIKELTSDDEEGEDEQNNDLEKKANPRKHLRSDKNPYVEEPEEDVEGSKNKQLHITSEFNRANAKRQQNGSFFFQSSTVSYGGPSGTYYTSSTTRRAGGDGVVMEESKEADLTNRKASHRISKGMHGKGHSVTRKLNSDGRVDTLQTLHNLNEDELENFEEDWSGKARQYLPNWSSALDNDKMRDHHPSRDHAAENSGARRPHKGVTLDDGASFVTSDSVTVFHKKFHFPNDLVATVPKRSDRACLPPPGYIVVYETHLRAGLRFLPPPELIHIAARCGVSLAQLSYRATSVTIGLIAFFRDRGVVLTPECLSRMRRFISDGQGRVTFRSKWLDIRTRDPLKSWSSAFFFVKNDWGLIEKWGKLNDLLVPLHIKEEDIMRILKVPDIEHLLYELLRRKDLEAELTHSLNEWSNEFVKIKYLQGEYKQEYDSRIKEVKLDRLQMDFEGARTMITQLRKDQKASVEKVAALEAENKKSRTLLAEKEVALSDLESSMIIEDFKKSIALKIIIQDHVQDARDHIYVVEVKVLEQQCIDEGFIRGFLKGVRLMQRKTGVTVEGLTLNQASGDPSSDLDGDEIESELQMTFALEVDDEIVDIE